MDLNTPGFWKGKKVFVTGHTGFKGSWLCFWLDQMGAIVSGYSLPAESSPNLSHLLNFSSTYKSHFDDVRNFSVLSRTLQAADPEIIFHLAAQPIVSEGYNFPLETFSTNIMGTANLLEAARSCPNLKVFLNITTDKVYDNSTQAAHKESDLLGGKDPYSASKVCSEFLTSAMRDSFFTGTKVATARAGNVIGGGDWALNRIFPDIYRAHESNTALEIRNPSSVRPWQHVLDSVSGYLMYAEYLFASGNDYVKALNFSPDHASAWTVDEILRFIQKNFPEYPFQVNYVGATFKEEAKLVLDSTLARKTLGWKSRLNTPEAISRTIEWYCHFSEGKKADDLIRQQIQNYL